MVGYKGKISRKHDTAIAAYENSAINIGGLKVSGYDRATLAITAYKNSIVRTGSIEYVA